MPHGTAVDPITSTGQTLQNQLHIQAEANALFARARVDRILESMIAAEEYLQSVRASGLGYEELTMFEQLSVAEIEVGSQRRRVAKPDCL